MAGVWERLQGAAPAGSDEASPSSQDLLGDLGEVWGAADPPQAGLRPPRLEGRTLGQIEELFRRPVQDLSPAEREELFGVLADQVAQREGSVGRAVSWARAQFSAGSTS